MGDDPATLSSVCRFRSFAHLQQAFVLAIRWETMFVRLAMYWLSLLRHHHHHHHAIAV